MAKILIVDDEKPIRNTLREILEFEDYQIAEAEDGDSALREIMSGGYDVVLCDVKMPKKDGMEVLEQARQMQEAPQFIMISGHGTIETAVDATKMGAFDFIEKPPDLNRLLVSIRNAMEKTSLVQETKSLRRKVSKTHEIVGQSQQIEAIKQTIEKIAPTDARVLITGSNGTGKELVARWIHEMSPRASHPFVEVNCAAIPSELIESELFGHEKGAFTGAIKQRAGKFEQASGGTLLLDEIGDMSFSAQAKVLRALQEGKINRVGGDKDIAVDTRVIAATNKDLAHEIDAGNFREDLYHRLSVILIHVPALRERPEDIPPLAEAFMQEICREYGFPAKELQPDALQALQQLEWTGNVRELRNVLERLAIFCETSVTAQDVQTYALPRKPGKKRSAGGEELYDRFERLQDFKDHAEREFVLRKLQKHSWNISKTAEEIGIQRSHLYNKIDKYGLNAEKPASPHG
jgi:DNA-binding NtrC family response regulator